jgi:hypothetical protein
LFFFLYLPDMPTITFVTRARDGLPLAESIDDEKDHRELDALKQQAKQLLGKLRSSAESRQSFETGAHVFQYVILFKFLCM